MSQRPLKEGDIVQPKGYVGTMIIQHFEPMLSEEAHWFCVDEEYDTCFDTYAESELMLIED